MMLGTETEDSHRPADAAGAPRRVDYGAVRLGQRYIHGLILCAEHFGAPYDLLAAALGAQPARLRGITARWRRAGYAATGSRGVGLLVVTLTGDRICAMARFDNSVLPWFGLPQSLPS